MFSQPPKHHPLKMTIIPSTLKKTKKKNISLLKTKYTRLVHQTQSINHSHSNNKSTVQIKFNNYKNKTKINPKKKKSTTIIISHKDQGQIWKTKKRKLIRESPEKKNSSGGDGGEETSNSSRERRRVKKRERSSRRVGRRRRRRRKLLNINGNLHSLITVTIATNKVVVLGFIELKSIAPSFAIVSNGV